VQRLNKQNLEKFWTSPATPALQTAWITGTLYWLLQFSLDCVRSLLGNPKSNTLLPCKVSLAIPCLKTIQTACTHPLESIECDTTAKYTPISLPRVRKTKNAASAKKFFIAFIYKIQPTKRSLDLTSLNHWLCPKLPTAIVWNLKRNTLRQPLFSTAWAQIQASFQPMSHATNVKSQHRPLDTALSGAAAGMFAVLMSYPSVPAFAWAFLGLSHNPMPQLWPH